MNTIKKDQGAIYENIIMLMDRFPGLLSVMFTLIIVAGFIR